MDPLTPEDEAAVDAILAAVGRQLSGRDRIRLWRALQKVELKYDIRAAAEQSRGQRAQGALSTIALTTGRLSALLDRQDIEQMISPHFLEPGDPGWQETGGSTPGLDDLKHGLLLLQQAAERAAGGSGGPVWTSDVPPSEWFYSIGLRRVGERHLGLSSHSISRPNGGGTPSGDILRFVRAALKALGAKTFSIDTIATGIERHRNDTLDNPPRRRRRRHALGEADEK